MSDLSDFLLARIAEDETVAHEAAVKRGPVITSTKVSGVWLNSRYHMTIDPARALAECEAKRRIVEQFGAAEVLLDNEPMAEQVKSSITPPHAYWTASREVVKHLASVYADHPDYRDEWALSPGGSASTPG